jgi:hypothetical protein
MQGLMLLNESQELLQENKNKKGNGHIRRALFMPAFVAVKHNEKNQWIYIIAPLKNMALK